jgi:hypothetical protein
MSQDKALDWLTAQQVLLRLFVPALWARARVIPAQSFADAFD